MILRYRIQGGALMVASIATWSLETASIVGFHAPRLVQNTLAAMVFGFMIVGSGSYLYGKGYHPAFGLFGILPPLGLTVAIVAPDLRIDNLGSDLQTVQDQPRQFSAEVEAAARVSPLQAGKSEEREGSADRSVGDA